MKRSISELALATALMTACGPMSPTTDVSGTDATAQDVQTADHATPVDVPVATDVQPDVAPQPDVPPTPDVTALPDVVALPDATDASAPDVVVAPDAACAAWTTPPTVDASIALPSDAGTPPLVLHAAATGSQNYACMSTVPTDGGATAYTWTFVGPVAELRDCSGATVGIHFASPGGATAPEWESLTDGSSVIGHRISAYTPDPTAVPWLLLGATSHSGSGLLSTVQFVQRLNTVGGIAPAAGCDVDHVGAVQNVAYSADYYFFGM